MAKLISKFPALVAAVLITSLYTSSAVFADDGTSPATQARSIAAELGFLIGNWTCRNTEPGKPEIIEAHVTYEWAYDKKTLKETLSLPGYTGTFFTTLDKRTNKFKGVAIDNFGGYIIWENQRVSDTKSTEIGYQFDDGKLKPVSRTDFERLSDTHYIIRDFQADTPTGRGAPTDIEDCTKQVG
jgi:hypothetical protein